jgi:hypothetical protein
MANSVQQSLSWARLGRRELLFRSGLGFGGIALAALMKSQPVFADAAQQPNSDLRPRRGHFQASAKAVIQLVQSGGPSQMDLFDPKPELRRRAGKPHPDGVEIHQPNNANLLFPSPFEFSRHGQCGMEITELLPHLGTVVDDLCLIRSMYSEHNNHPEGMNLLQTCRIFPGRPVMGAWISYALGTENQNLPGFVVLRDPEGYSDGGKQFWTSGWLPALFQGVEFSTSGTPIRNLNPTEPLPPGVGRESLDFLGRLNGLHRRDHPGESELDARIQNYELAARMQLAAMEVLDFSKESEATKKLYGLDNPVTAGYGTRCLMARRLVEAGVRFVQIYPGPGIPWDHHKQIQPGLIKMCAKTDQPAAALIKDLKSRALLDSTMVMWAGEFGRLPTTQNSDGRDHNRNAFSLFFAGGGFKKGHIYGATDDFGYKAVVDRVSVPSLQATILRLLGIDHARLTYRHEGRDQTPTDLSITGAMAVPALMANPPAGV